MRMQLEKTYVFLVGIFFYFIVPSADIVNPAFSRGLTGFTDILSNIIVVFSGSSRYDFLSVGPVFSCNL